MTNRVRHRPGLPASAGAPSVDEPAIPHICRGFASAALSAHGGLIAFQRTRARLARKAITFRARISSKPHVPVIQANLADGTVAWLTSS
jgi:hypothetical protein